MSDVIQYASDDLEGAPTYGPKHWRIGPREMPQSKTTGVRRRGTTEPNPAHKEHFKRLLASATKGRQPDDET